MSKKLLKIANEMLSIANDLDDLELYSVASIVERPAAKIISARDMGVDNLINTGLPLPEDSEKAKEDRTEEDEALEETEEGLEEVQKDIDEIVR